MDAISLTEDTRLTGSYAATIGFFDGVHRGHRYVLEQLQRLAKEKGLPSMAITFDRHPRQVVDISWHPLLLTTLDEKQQLLEQTGIDTMVVLPFDKRMASLSAYRFMQQVLKERLGVCLLLTGYDNRFGHRTADSSEDFEDYVEYGRQMGIEVVCGEGLKTTDDRIRRPDDRRYVSSSLVRQLLTEGCVEEAAQCLGRPYSLTGTVVHGFGQGRKMGFPTANMQINSIGLTRFDSEGNGLTRLDTGCQRLVPKDGVYAVRVRINTKPYQTVSNRCNPSQTVALPGITNIGLRPTFDGHQRTIETHILDFQGDLYGKDISIEFVKRLRDEQHFDSAEELARQMTRDAETAKTVLTTTNYTNETNRIGTTD